jgi:hypothetical protein
VVLSHSHLIASHDLRSQYSSFGLFRLLSDVFPLVVQFGVLFILFNPDLRPTHMRDLLQVLYALIYLVV